MTDQPAVSADAPLRHRLWFRFWRGWRKAMIGLVVVVVVAWGTRPNCEDLRLLLEIRFLEMWVELPSNKAEWAPLDHPVRKMLAELKRGDRSSLSGASLEPTLACQDHLLFSLARENSGIRAIGAFGRVWVLD